MAKSTGADRADQAPDNLTDPRELQYVPDDADWAEHAEWCAAQAADEPPETDDHQGRTCDRCGDELLTFRGEAYCPTCTCFVPAA